MRFSIPGVDGLYFDTDAASPAVNLALTVAGRQAPKPQGYAVQLLPYVWSFDLDLQEVPADHPIQYLHPESAPSLGTISGDRTINQAGTELESVLRFIWAVNREVETASNRLVGREPSTDGISIEITDGQIEADGAPLETDEFDIDGSGSAAGVRSRSSTEIDIDAAQTGSETETSDDDQPSTDGSDDPAGDRR